VLSDPPRRSLKQYRLPPEFVVSGSLGDSRVLISASPAAESLFSYIISSPFASLPNDRRKVKCGKKLCTTSA
jgi:hypothetical protein